MVHGGAELVPISSSGHTTLLAWQRRWRYDQLDPSARKRFEVALHAGTTAALLIVVRHELGHSPTAVVVLACIPPAIAGKLLQGPIERRLGTPPTIAVGLLGGSVAMALAERFGGRERVRADAGPADAAALGAAQALALIPGVSRSGATRAAARWRGFSPLEAEALATDVGLPITLGALALEASQASRSDPSEWAALGVGALAAFVSTLVGAAALARMRGGRSLLPYAAYRVAVATAVVRRLRQNGPR